MKFFDIFLIFAQNIDCVYTLNRLGEAVLMSTHVSMFKSKNKKNIKKFHLKINILM